MAVGGVITEQQAGPRRDDPAALVSMILTSILYWCEVEGVEPYGHLDVEPFEELPIYEGYRRGYRWVLTPIQRLRVVEGGCVTSGG